MLILLILQFGGILIVFNIKQVIVQHQMKEKMENESSKFENLTLTTNQYKKCRINSKEIYFNGKMYDIKSIAFVGDSVKIMAIDDIEEKKIMDIIKMLSNKANDQNKNLPSQIQYITLLQYISPNSELEFLAPCFQIKIFYQAVFDFKSNKPEVQTPPPR